MVSLTQHSNAYKLLWHYNLGHPSIKVLKYGTLGKENMDIIACNKYSICLLAKQTRFPLHTSTSKVVGVFDFLHLKVWGHIGLLLLMVVDFPYNCGC